MIGKTVGHYQVIDKIGEGGMGAVYKAEDTTLHRLVALKTLSGHLTEDEEAQERFVREAQAASSLNHPNITTIYEFLEEDDTRLICMEYIEGKTIRDMVESGVVSVRKAIDIIVQAAEALDAAHGKGILHRDVKSANIMVNMEGRVKIMDFGLAHLEGKSQLTRTGTTMGTLSYSSPEQISGRTVDRGSEVFSLGVVFYELLTGQLPFKASNEAEILFAIINNEPPKLSKLRDDVPELVEAVVSKMLEKDSEVRYQSCADVIHDLQGIRKEMETSTVGITGVLGRVQASRNKVMIQKITAGVAFVAIAVTGYLLLTRNGVRLDTNLAVVAPFANLSGDDSITDLGKMAALMITDGLQRTMLVDVVHSEDASYSWRYVQSTAESSELRKSPSQILAEETGAGILISGTYSVEGDDIQFSARIIDSRNGRIVKSIEPVSALLDDPNSAIEQLTEHIMGYFGVVSDERIVGTVSPTYAAYRAFSDGMDFYQRFEVEAALPHFYQAFHLDSTFAKSLIYAAHCLYNLGRAAEQDSVAGLLLPFRNQLNDLDRYWLDYIRFRVDGNWEQCTNVMRQAAEIAPASKAEYNYANSAWKTFNPKITVEVLENLDPERGSMRDWFYYWYQLSHGYHMLGEYKHALIAIRRGLNQYPGNAVLMPMECYSLAALGKIREVIQLLKEEHFLPNKAITWLRTALELREHGYPEAAAEILKDLIDFFRALPAEEQRPRASQAQLAGFLYNAERWDEAQALFDELNMDYPDSYDDVLGCLAARRGDREEALYRIGRLEELYGNEKYNYGEMEFSQSWIYALLGEKQQAVNLLELGFSKGLIPALRIFREIDFDPLRDYPPFEALIRPKG
ncbi:protein kinase [Gemmatimonadota bacterium]